jgi:hypothetical protein
MGNMISSMDFVGKRTEPAQGYSYTCGRCNGIGSISYYSHIAGGICFRCGGSGMTCKKDRYSSCSNSYEKKIVSLKPYPTGKSRWYVVSALKNGRRVVLKTITDISMEPALKRIDNELHELKHKQQYDQVDWSSLEYHEGELGKKRNELIKQLKLSRL